MRSDSRKREETSTFPAVRRSPEEKPPTTIRHGTGNNLKSLASVPEKMWENEKDNLRALALSQKHTQQLTLHQTDP